MKNIVRSLALAIGLIASLASAFADPVTPPGSRLSLTPPKGFGVATTFTGFLDQASGASIMLVEFPPAGFRQISDGLNAESIAKHGMRLLSRETIDGLPYEQVTIRAEQRLNGQTFDKWMMTINGPDITGMVTVTLPKPAPARLSDTVIRAALGSVRINATSAGDPIAALPFSIAPTARFKFQKPLAGRGLLFKETPPPPEGQLDDAGFIVTLAADATVASADQKDFGEQQFLNSKTITDKTVLSSKPITTSNASGFEFLAEGKQSSGRPERYLFVALYPAGHPFILMGFAPAERFDEALPDFRAMVESFRSKM
jgi:hypothetical protein